MISDNPYENLEEYYNDVRICSLCKKPFGTDVGGDNGQCPICDNLLKKTTPGALNRIIQASWGNTS